MKQCYLLTRGQQGVDPYPRFIVANLPAKIPYSYLESNSGDLVGNNEKFKQCFLFVSGQSWANCPDIKGEKGRYFEVLKTKQFVKLNGSAVDKEKSNKTKCACLAIVTSDPKDEDTSKRLGIIGCTPNGRIGFISTKDFKEMHLNTLYWNLAETPYIQTLESESLPIVVSDKQSSSIKKYSDFPQGFIDKIKREELFNSACSYLFAMNKEPDGKENGRCLVYVKKGQMVGPDEDKSNVILYDGKNYVYNTIDWDKYNGEVNPPMKLEKLSEADMIKHLNREALSIYGKHRWYLKKFIQKHKINHIDYDEALFGDRGILEKNKSYVFYNFRMREEIGFFKISSPEAMKDLDNDILNNKIKMKKYRDNVDSSVELFEKDILPFFENNSKESSNKLISCKKKAGKHKFVYPIDANDAKFNEMLQAGKIVRADNDPDIVYVKSTECVASGSKGEKALLGDFYQIDGEGNPYPNKKDWVAKNMKHLQDYEYEVVPKPMKAYQMELCGENNKILDFLQKHNGLKIDKTNEAAYYTAELWGAVQSAPKDAYIVLTDMVLEDKKLKSTKFYFNIKSEFERDFEVL